jgi:hypothetical protein
MTRAGRGLFGSSNSSSSTREASFENTLKFTPPA